MIPLDKLLEIAREARDIQHVGTERYMSLFKFQRVFEPATAVRVLERLRDAEEALRFYAKHKPALVNVVDDDDYEKVLRQSYQILTTTAKAHFEKYPEAK